MSFRQQAVEPAKPVGLVLSCFLGYGPQGGLPTLFRRSYGAGFLCRLRRYVGPLAQFGPTCAGLPLATMDRSESLLSVRVLFLSLSAPSLPVPVVGAEGVCRASQFPVGAFFACHALGPRQTPSAPTTGTGREGALNDKKRTLTESRDSDRSIV